MLNNSAALAAFVLVAALLLSPAVRRSKAWRATVTPLASIIGSGFLVSFPLLAGAFGALAPLAMAVLFGASYAMGAVMRFNIAHAEPLFKKDKKAWVRRAEQVSQIILAGAYFISVTYYLALLAAFALKGVGLVGPAEDGAAARWVATGLLAAIGGWGLLRGFKGLEGLEEAAVGAKLAVIAAVIAALAALNIEHLLAGSWRIGEPAHAVGVENIRLLLGMLIIVQGFETSRFLDAAYPADLRVKTMKRAQWLAGAIYVAFFGLGMVVMNALPAHGDAAAVTDMVAPAAAVLPLMLIGGAVFAQLSAAVADAIGAAGLIHEATGERIPLRSAYPVIAAVGIVIIWLTDIYQVITLASRAFALYYAAQCLVGFMAALKDEKVSGRWPRLVGLAVMGLLMTAVFVFGVPADKIG